jgi:uroporphyrinogen decarboxylase
VGLKNEKLLLRALRGETLEVPPLWLMRQAGRYLPEYRALRSKTGSFLELCLTPELAEEITLQPVRRFSFDAAILFADILLVPYALGQKLWFVEGEGPRLEPLTVRGADELVGVAGAVERLTPVFETIRSLRKSLPEQTALIGFAGAPWTVATYMIAGAGSQDSAAARMFALREPEAFAALIDVLVDATVEYLVAQANAGAEVLQIFESWAATIPGESIAAFSVEPLTRIVERVRAKTAVPIIVFPRGAGANYLRYDAIGADALSLDSHLSLDAAVGMLKTRCLQGNLDPFRLVAGGKPLEDSVRHIRRVASMRPFIFNLGHGVRPETPVEHVAELVALVREAAA